MLNEPQVSLQAFVRSALLDIALGVKEANADAKAAVGDGAPQFVLRGNRGDPARSTIEFDIAISASKARTQGAGFTLTFAGTGGGAKTDRKSGAESAQRIRFQVSLESDFRP